MTTRLLLIACGGTISATPHGPDGATPHLGAADLAADLDLDPAVEIETVTHSTVASSAMTLVDALTLHERIARWLEQGSGAVVITHGTDTLEETAFALDLLHRRPEPVVITGAMRHTGLAGPDGPANLAAAVAVALSPDARDLGVLVVMHDEIHLAALAAKSHTSAAAAFRSSTVGPVGYLVEGAPRLVLRPADRATLSAPPPGTDVVPVALLGSGIGDDGRLLAAVPGSGFGGAVVQALGGGHLPPAYADAAERLATRIPVLLTSRTGAGEVLRHSYDFPGSETDLIGRGLIPAGRLDGPKARVLLTLLLSTGTPRDLLAGEVGRLAGG